MKNKVNQSIVQIKQLQDKLTEAEKKINKPEKSVLQLSFENVVGNALPKIKKFIFFRYWKFREKKYDCGGDRTRVKSK